MAPRERRQGWVDWAKSTAKKIVMDDLEQDLLPLDEDVMSTEECWNIYKQYPEFVGIQFSQFRLRLADHREQVRKIKNVSSYDEESFQRDRMLHPKKNRNQRGELVFDGSTAQQRLVEDVKDKKHKRMSPTTLYYSRPEYQAFSLDKFRARIYQEERRRKFIFHLEVERAEKKKQFQRAKHHAEDGDSQN